MLPTTVPGLLYAVGINMAAFAVIVGVALFASRASAGDLLLKCRHGIRAFFLGAVYSVALRAILFVIMMIVMVILIMTKDAATAQSMVDKMRPDTAKLISPQALTHSPVYLTLCLTLVSFVVAGFREELWRSGMMLGIIKLLEPRVAGRAASILAVLLSSLLFGLGHMPQGWGAVGLTTLLGLGFGIMMVFHKSIWEAVFAHGFFDATTFLLIYLLLKYFPGKVPGF